MVLKEQFDISGHILICCLSESDTRREDQRLVEICGLRGSYRLEVIQQLGAVTTCSSSQSHVVTARFPPLFSSVLSQRSKSLKITKCCFHVSVRVKQTKNIV